MQRSSIVLGMRTPFPAIKDKSLVDYFEDTNVEAIRPFILSAYDKVHGRLEQTITYEVKEGDQIQTGIILLEGNSEIIQVTTKTLETLAPFSSYDFYLEFDNCNLVQQLPYYMAIPEYAQ